MLWLLFDRPSSALENLPYKEQLQQNVNLIPLYTIGNYLHVVIHRSNDAVFIHCVINLLGNILLFIPAGWMIPMLWKAQRNFFRFFITCAGAIFLVEILQLFTFLGSFDVDDIILNLFGMTLGFIFYHIFRKKQ